MQKEANTNLERIIAKIDNDFNPNNSDWIPRVGAWVIDVMSIIDVTPTVKKKRKLKVIDRIAYYGKKLSKYIKVYTCDGCEVKAMNSAEGCGCNKIPSTGKQKGVELSNTMEEFANPNADEHILAIGFDKADKNRVDHTVTDIHIASEFRNYVIVDGDKIELNFDTDCIIIECEEIETEDSIMCGCEMPVIPNNGLLIEAIVYYCMYKMLCRGYKHPVFNLAASQYGTNPYFIWEQYKEKARRSVINDGVNQVLDSLWRSSFFISTFDPRN